jgi:hypothetical protein
VSLAYRPNYRTLGAVGTVGANENPRRERHFAEPNRAESAERHTSAVLGGELGDLVTQDLY